MEGVDRYLLAPRLQVTLFVIVIFFVNLQGVHEEG